MHSDLPDQRTPRARIALRSAAAGRARPSRSTGALPGARGHDDVTAVARHVCDRDRLDPSPRLKLPNRLEPERERLPLGARAERAGRPLPPAPRGGGTYDVGAWPVGNMWPRPTGRTPTLNAQWRLPMKFVAAVGLALPTVSLSAAYTRLLAKRPAAAPHLRCGAAEGKGASHLRDDAPDVTRFGRSSGSRGWGRMAIARSTRRRGRPTARPVLYSTFRGIWTIRGVDGKRKRSVLDVGSHAWAPNGREVVFVQRVEESQADALFRVGVDGSGLRRITTPVESDTTVPRGRPTGAPSPSPSTTTGRSRSGPWAPTGRASGKIAEKARRLAGRLTAGESSSPTGWAS